MNRLFDVIYRSGMLIFFAALCSGIYFYFIENDPSVYRQMVIIGSVSSMLMVICSIAEVNRSTRLPAGNKTLWTVFFLFFNWIAVTVYLVFQRQKFGSAWWSGVFLSTFCRAKRLSQKAPRIRKDLFLQSTTLTANSWFAPVIYDQILWSKIPLRAMRRSGRRWYSAALYYNHHYSTTSGIRRWTSLLDRCEVVGLSVRSLMKQGLIRFIFFSSRFIVCLRCLLRRHDSPLVIQSLCNCRKQKPKQRVKE